MKDFLKDGDNQMNKTNAVNDARQAAVEPACGSTGVSDTSIGDGDAGTPASAVKAEFTSRRQSTAENSKFRKMRLENEAYKKEIERLKNELSVTEKRSAEYEKYKAQNDIYLSTLIDNKMRADLEAIRGIDPGVSDLASIGGDFLRLIENGVDAKVAFSAVRAANEDSLVKRPPETGSVGVTEDAQGEFFSSRELDRLTPRDLDNPVIFKKAMKSLKRL